MTHSRPSEIVNPVQTIRDWRGKMTPERRAESEAAQAAFSLLGVAQLREVNARLFVQPISPNTPETIMQLWLANVELTRRGVGPRWRNLPAYVAPEAAPSIPECALLPGAPRPISHASRKRALLRWIDLDWLACTLGPGHVPDHAHWRKLFARGLDESTAERIANSSLPSRKLSGIIRIPEPHSFTLTGLLTRDSAERIKTARKRRDQLSLTLLTQCARSRMPLSPDDMQSRLQWIEAIELTDGSPTVAAQLYGWMSGDTVTRQTAHEKRRKLAMQLGLKTAAWR